MTRAFPAVGAWALLTTLAVGASGCRQDMHDQPRYEPQEASAFFADGRGDRPRVPGTVARGELRLDTHLYEGQVDGELVTAFPYPVDGAMLDRGRQRYDIFCQPCHGVGGDGDGMIVRRGFPAPPSLHLQRLADAPPGHFFDVISNGLGRMYGYADRVPVHDRWAIIAWIEVLQRSRQGDIEEIPKTERDRLRAEARP